MKRVGYIYNPENKSLLVKINEDSFASSTDFFVTYIFMKNKKQKSFYFKSKKFSIKMTEFLYKKIKVVIYYVKDSISSKFYESEDLFFVDNIKGNYNTIVIGSYKSLKEKGYQCRKDSQAIDIDKKINWINKDRNLAFNLNSWRFLSPIWHEFFITYKFSLLMEIKEKILEYYGFIYNNEIRRKEFLWYDMSCALRGIHISLFFDVIKNLNVVLTNEETNKFNDLFVIHLEKLQDKDFLSHGNHGVWQIISLRMLASFYIGHDKENIISFTEDKMTELLNFIFNKDGFTSENSPYYHEYNCGLLNTIPPSLFEREKKKIKSVVSNKKNLLSWFTDFSGNLFMIGDTEGKGFKFRADKSMYFDGYYLLNLSDSNYLIYRGDKKSNSFLCFYAPNKNLIHKHADNLSFIYGLNGCNIFTDSGKYSYDHSDLRKHFVSDKAHNVICLENTTFYPENIVLNESFLENIKCEDNNLDCCFKGISSYIKDGKCFKWKRQIDIVSSGEIFFRDEVLVNDFCEKEYINLISDVNIFLTRKSNNEILISKNNSPVAILEVLTTCDDIIISLGSNESNEGWVSHSYYKKEPVYFVKIFLKEGVSVSWKLKPIIDL